MRPPRAVRSARARTAWRKALAILDDVGDSANHAVQQAVQAVSETGAQIDLWAYAADAETPVDGLAYSLDNAPLAGAPSHASRAANPRAIQWAYQRAAAASSRPQSAFR